MVVPSLKCESLLPAMKWLFLCIILAILYSGEAVHLERRYGDFGGCDVANYVTKVGCFKDDYPTQSRRPLPEELINIRDPTNPNYVAALALNWTNWEESVNGLLCECAKRARNKGYQYIGLQFYGECWSGPYSSTYSVDGPSSNCIQEYNTPCDKSNRDHACVGESWTNYVYSVSSYSSYKKRESKKDSGSGRRTSAGTSKRRK